ncbi:hypothetical protein M2447_002791 [Ereboglobus sp. PH5-10]|uniref:hypothetical protein n=1 Tax=Ereboglobus sp. PH5-10 TaxID=2940629 RepID=UPI0024065AD0|nr:hypothetical protein [Ereboglobus sp. PH5-10]MDF9828663.1 hypothetical protein [Ereboglobus sp. PH5-10]
MDENLAKMGGEKSSRPLAAMRSFQAPNLIILSRAEHPPIPGLAAEVEPETLPENADLSGKGTKRELRGMSVKSALNIAKVLSSIDWDKNGTCIHASLTYWKTWPRPDELAKTKSALVRDLGRHFACGIWRLEYQKRMVPHFHCLLWLGACREFECAEEYEARCKASLDWLVSWWKKFSENDSEFAIKITSGDQVRGTWYLAMHAAKREQAPSFAVGRWWGYINRKVLLGAQDMHETGVVDERERVWWARLYRRATGCKTRKNCGFSWFLPNASQWKASAWIRDHIEAEKQKRWRPEDPF